MLRHVYVPERHARTLLVRSVSRLDLIRTLLKASHIKKGAEPQLLSSSYDKQRDPRRRWRRHHQVERQVTAISFLIRAVIFDV